MRNFWSLFPPNLLSKGVKILSDATETPNDDGVRWSERGKCSKKDLDGENCAVTMDYIYKWLFIGFLVWFVLAIDRKSVV